MNQIYLYGPIVAGVLALLYAFYKATWVSKQDPGNERMQKIGSWIADGAMAFLAAEYKVLAIFIIAVAGALAASNAGLKDSTFMIAVSFVVGAFCSALAGYLGMKVATKANYRTASAARQGLNGALQVAFSGGSVMGLTVVGLGLLGLGILFIIYKAMYGFEFVLDTRYGTISNSAPLNVTLNVLSGFSLGASSIALFARVGGGIYTKAADVGADLVGKVEAGIPEDHPLNPATIADNVGDNVGDVAGMGADLFESYVGAIVSSMILGTAWYMGMERLNEGTGMNAIYLPMVIGFIGVICSILGTFLVRTKEGGNPQTALNIGTFGAGGLMVIGTVGAIYYMFPHEGIKGTDVITGNSFEFQWWGLVLAVVGGLVAGIGIGAVTEFYTATQKMPVNRLVESSRTGAATTVIQGLALG
ncbi:MAG: sodium/proton-translocating pyrophosphatase, partial [Polyangia bacterium]|nr:sodium/proton-translocating pyrophosphatase [Polyangia bacterium]